MSYVSPHIKEKFESMPLDLKNAILARNVHLENMNDLMSVLEQIIAEGKAVVDPSSLPADARRYFDSLPKEEQLTMLKSNLSLQSLKELQEFCARMSPRSGDVLYQVLPEPAVPSNQLLDELDSE